jgi:hypothetical protein
LRSIKSKSVAIAALLTIGLIFCVNVGTASAAPKGSSVCIQDNNTFNYITWNTTTGAYTFQDCSAQGSPITGTGTVKVVDNIQYLTDNESNIKVSAAYSQNQLTGTATVLLSVATGVWQTVRINDTDPTSECPICEIEAPSGSVSILVFLGLVLGWLAWGIFRVRRARGSA